MPHPNKGRKQSPEQVAKRVAAVRASGAYERNGKRITLLNKSRIGQPLPEAQKRKQSATNMGRQFALGTKRSVEFRRKLSDYWAANREKHNFYVDGLGWKRGYDRNIAMGRLDYRLWREAVFARDNWTCADCGQRGGKLQADHIKPWATHKALRYEVSNGQTLCVPCHKKTPTYCGRTRPAEQESALCP